MLDTHAFLWWITGNPRLSDRAREVIADGRNELFFSAGSGWEIAIKAGLGRLEVLEDLGRFMSEQLSRNAFEILPVHLSRALRVHALPDHHRHPFDRLLVDQSLLEELPVLSAGPRIALYPVEAVW